MTRLAMPRALAAPAAGEAGLQPKPTLMCCLS